MEHQQSLARYGKVVLIAYLLALLVLKMVLKSMEIVCLVFIYAYSFDKSTDGNRLKRSVRCRKVRRRNTINSYILDIKSDAINLIDCSSVLIFVGDLSCVDIKIWVVKLCFGERVGKSSNSK